MRNLTRWLVVWVLCIGVAAPRPGKAALLDAGFASFLQSVWPDAQARGISRTVFDGVVNSLVPDPALLDGGTRQAEFDRTIKSYLDDAVTLGRIEHGRQMAVRWHVEIAAVERRYGVPVEIVLALWGMESDFGRSTGNKDVLRSLATLAFARPDDGFREEFIAAMEILANGSARRQDLKGSWAGATGNPQFMPSTYLAHAVAYSSQTSPDIWNSVPDSLASMANFLRQRGWKAGQKWGTEVSIPASFNWQSLRASAEDFALAGIRPTSGPRKLPASDDLTLYFPAGASGPALALTENYWVIKQYNNSDSYAVAVAFLAERIARRPGITGRWPTDFQLLSRADRIRLQVGLRDKGFYTEKIDGRFGPSSRDAIHRFQRSISMFPADGFPSAEVLDRLVK